MGYILANVDVCSLTKVRFIGHAGSATDLIIHVTIVITLEMLCLISVSYRTGVPRLYPSTSNLIKAPGKTPLLRRFGAHDADKADVCMVNVHLSPNQPA